MLGKRLPKASDPGDEKVLANIREFGFHAIHVRKGAHPEHAAEEAKLPPNPTLDAGFSYTVGLPFSHDHPELVITGALPDERAHGILWEAVHLIERGARFAPGDETDDILDGHRVRFAPVSPYWRKEALTFADWAARRKPFEALQLLWPDRDGHLPDSPDYAGPAQPLLD